MISERTPSNYYAGPYLEREAERREDPEWFHAALQDPETLYVVSRGTTHLLIVDPEPRVAFLSGAHPLVAALAERRAVLLGRFRGARCVLMDLSDADDLDEVTPNARFEELRPLASVLPYEDAALLAYARALTVWRSRHRFCGRCGSPTAPRRAGHVLSCTNASCGQEAFPRIDPAIIVLITDGERALLGRQASWPPGRYSTIAGFVEPGESLEDAVAREVHEETGVHVADVHYHSSQPWPFPSSLMLGFIAEASSVEIVRHDGELEDAAWFTRSDIASGTPMLPTSTSISYRLIENWFDANSDVPLAEQPGVLRWDSKRERR